MNNKPYTFAILIIVFITIIIGIAVYFESITGPAYSLLEAVRNDDIRKIEVAIANGANINIQGDHDETPVSIAVARNNIEAVKILLEHGADPNIPDLSGIKPLLHTSSQKMVELLRKHGAKVENIFEAAMLGDNESILKFLKNDPTLLNAHFKAYYAYNYGIKTRAYHSSTPLICATKMGRADTVELLLTSGADVNKTGQRGTTALHYAAIGNDKSIIHLLIKHGALVNSEDENLRTPLHYSAMYGQKLAVTEALLKNGADVEAKDCNGKTPLYYAESTKHEATAELIKSYIRRKSKHIKH